MNRTQKEALGTLIFLTVTNVFMASILVVRLIFKKDVVFATYIMLATIVIMNVLGLLYIMRKQSPREVITDERDKLIRLRALFASFVSVMISLAVMLVALRIVVGVEGSIGVWLLILVLFFIFIAAAMVYSVAVLIQYGRGQPPPQHLSYDRKTQGQDEAAGGKQNE
jgi:hypothetical protein